MPGEGSGGSRVAQLTGLAVAGAGLVSRKTRMLAVIGLLGYGAYLAGNVVRNR